MQRPSLSFLNPIRWITRWRMRWRMRYPTRYPMRDRMHHRHASHRQFQRSRSHTHETIPWRLNRWSRVMGMGSSLAILVVLNWPHTSHAEVLSYYGKCSLLNDNPELKSIEQMPCYVMDGTRSLPTNSTAEKRSESTAFFNFRLQNGTQTELTVSPGNPFRDRSTSKSYRRVEPFKFVANVDGETIIIEDLKPTSDRYQISDQALDSILKEGELRPQPRPKSLSQEPLPEQP